jgi:hypothetical protein
MVGLTVETLLFVYFFFTSFKNVGEGHGGRHGGNGTNTTHGTDGGGVCHVFEDRVAWGGGLGIPTVGK